MVIYMVTYMVIYLVIQALLAACSVYIYKQESSSACKRARDVLCLCLCPPHPPSLEPPQGVHCTRACVRCVTFRIQTLNIHTHTSRHIHTHTHTHTHIHDIYIYIHTHTHTCMCVCVCVCVCIHVRTYIHTRIQKTCNAHLVRARGSETTKNKK